MTTAAIIPGSLQAIALHTGGSVAEAFVAADTVILVDGSSSMDTRDSRDGKSRYTVACEELTRLQQSLPGKIAVIAFSSAPEFCPSGRPVYLGGSTDLAEALTFVKVADGCDMRFIVISDGEPNSESAALAAATTFTSRIDTVFVGPEGGAGQRFLQQLANASGGQHIKAHQVQALADGVRKLLTA